MAKIFQTQEEALAATQAQLQREGYGKPVPTSMPEQPVAQVPKSYWDDPAKVVRWHDAITSMPKDQTKPSWMDSDALEQAYKWLEYSNKGLPASQWKPSDDPSFKSFLNNMETPPNDSLLPWEQDYKKEAPAIVDPYDKVGAVKTDFKDMAAWQKLYDIFTNVESEGLLGLGGDVKGKGAILAGAAMKGLGAYGSIAMGSTLLAGGAALTVAGAPAAPLIAAGGQIGGALVGLGTFVNEAMPAFGAESSQEIQQVSSTIVIPFQWGENIVRGTIGLLEAAPHIGVNKIISDLGEVMFTDVTMDSKTNEAALAIRTGQAAAFEAPPPSST
jgi:hypothetical protein